jgi:hypothetical protein
MIISTQRRVLTDTRQWLQIRTWWGQCIALWLTVTLILTMVGLVTVRVAELGEGYEPAVVDALDGLSGTWVRWDSHYYLMLANEGYKPYPIAMGFFPLYPLLMVGVSFVTGLGLSMSGLLISHLSYLVAILCFYKLARLIRDEHAYAMRSVLYLVLFPSSFFFLAVYAESLSLCFSILAVYLVLRARPFYMPAGLALGIASLARPVGWLLDVVLLTEFIRRRKFSLSAIIPLGVGLAYSVSGVVLFVLYLYSLTGTFLAIPKAQAAWLRQWQYPWTTYWESVHIALTGSRVPGDWFLYAINWVDLSFTTLALILTLLAIWWSYRHRFSWSLSIYLACSLTFLLFSEGPCLQGSDQLALVPLWGMTRWVAALFPIYLVLGNVSQHKVIQWAIGLVSAGLLLLFTAWWTSGRWVG